MSAKSDMYQGDSNVNAELLGLSEAESILIDLASVFSSSATPTQPAAFDVVASQIQLLPEELRGVEARYRTLLEQISAVVFMAVIDGGISEAYVSPHIEELLGFSQEEWLNDPVRWYQQIHPEDRGRWSTEAAHMFLTGQPLRSEYRVIARDGRVIWFQCEAKMVRRDDGRPWFIHGVGFDVTELKQTEKELKEAHEELENRVRQRTAELATANAKLETEIAERTRAQDELILRAQELARSNSELEQFAYVASHDLKEPLRMVTSFAQLLGNRYRNRLDADADEFIHYIVDGASRMAQLINDLLEYSRVGTRGKPLEETPCSTAFIIACANLQTAIEESGAIITSDPLPSIIGDGTQLTQLFQNLIGNSIKFRAARPIRVHVGATQRNGEWLLSVADNGIGIEPQYADRIFVIFQRLHSKAEYPGTGIGLAICKKIVDRHGGRIWMESQLGKGSTFYVLLPATQS